MIYSFIFWTGILSGSQFALLSRIMSQAGYAGHGAHCPAEGLIPAASIANAADLAGSAAGGFAFGVFMLPVLGFGPTCALLAAIKGSSLLCLLGARGIAPDVR